MIKNLQKDQLRQSVESPVQIHVDSVSAQVKVCAVIK